MQELYNHKIRELEERINYLTRNNSALDHKSQQEQDQLKNNFEQEMEKDCKIKFTKCKITKKRFVTDNCVRNIF